MKLIPNSVTRSVATAVLRSRKNSPHILFGLGVVGVVGGTVLACRATLKLDSKLDDIQDGIDTVKEMKSNIENPESDYTERDYYKDLLYVYGRGAVDIAVLYGPAVVISGASIAALTGSHVTLTKRNTALTATVGLLHKAYEDYRGRVRTELGAERELDIYHAVESKIIETEDGEAKEVLKVADPNKFSPYARFFDEYCTAWEKDAELNRLFVQHQQNYLNHLLQSRGHVFLNEAYDAFGMERSRAGAIVGWYLGGDGNNYIDFGLFDVYNKDFINNRERSILLDFNVDGVIFDKL